MDSRFLRPASPTEAVGLRHETGGLFLAGGTELNWKGPPTARALISLDALTLSFVRMGDAVVELGAMLTLQDLADHHALVTAGLGVLPAASRRIGNRSIRCLATVGGNIGSNKSCSDLIPPLLVLNATLDLAGKDGEQQVPLEQYVSAPVPDALITAVRVPRPDPALSVAHERFSRSANDLAVINVALAVRRDGAHIAEARLALGGVAATVVRVPEAEAVLAGTSTDGDDHAVVERFLQVLGSHLHPIDDQRGSAAFKTDLAQELARRALAACVTDQGGAS